MAFMHFIFFEQSPSNVLPALFLFLLGGRPAFDFDPSFLAEIIDEQMLRYIIEWNQWALNQPVVPSSTIYSVLMAAELDVSIPPLLLDMSLLIFYYQPSTISASRSQQEHDGIHRSLLFSSALGAQDLTHHPDANALLSGLNMRLRAAGSGQQTLHMLDVSNLLLFSSLKEELINSFHQWFSTINHVKVFVRATCAPRLRSVDQVLSHISFRSRIDSDHPDTPLVLDRFKNHLFAYLRRAGHPDDKVIREILGEAKFSQGEGDGLLRVRAFLKTVRSSEFLPLQQAWTIKVNSIIIHY